MKRWSLFVMAAVSLLSIAGCESISGALGGASSSKARTAAKAVDITGRWTGKIEMPASNPNDPMAKLGEAMVGMMAGSLTLEIEPGDKFKMSLMGFPVEGSFVRDGLKLTLTAETAMGRPVAEAKKENPSLKDDKLYAEVSNDGSKITVRTKDNKPKDGEMVFVRAKEAAKQGSGPATVRAAEQGYVGGYSAELSGGKREGLSQDDLNEIKMAEAMLGPARLDLREDNSFTMNLMFEVAGTWKEEAGKLRLHMTKMVGMPEGGKTTSKDDLFLEVSGDRLVVSEPGPGGVKFAFVRN